MTDVRIINDRDFDAWDEYVRDSDAAGFFHRSGWLRAVQSAYGHTPKYLLAEHRDKVVGILPLFRVSVPFLGSYLASGVFTSHCGVCADNPDVAAALYEQAQHVARDTGARYVEIKNTDAQAVGDTPWETKDSYCTLKMAIDCGADAVWTKWPGKNRTNVRKAEKSGISVVFGADQLDEFYDLVAINMRLLGTPVHSKRFYASILREFPGDADIVTARLDDQPIAAVMTVGFKGEIQAFASVAVPQHRNLKPSALLYWDLIKRASERGYHTLDFGRSTWESGTFRFKSQLGAEPQPLYYDYFLNKQKHVPDVHQENPHFQLAIRAWQHLPLSLTRLLGPQLIRYVA